MKKTLSHPERRPRGFTLLEVLIAFAVLGLGLIMIAAIFPAALLEHSRTVDRSRALDLAANAEALLHNRIDPTRLYVNSADLAAGFDSPWYAIPFHNMTADRAPTNLPNGGLSGWDNARDYPHNVNAPTRTQRYYAAINNTPNFVNAPQLFGLDYLSDRVLPITDELANTATNRLVWHGFYRTTASGTRHFAIAVCKQRQNDEFARQRLDVADASTQSTPYEVPRVLQQDIFGSVATPRTRFPVPWRVNVCRSPNSQLLYIPRIQENAAFQNFMNDAIPLARLAPRGSKLLIQGRTYNTSGSGVLDFPGGRILTVSDTGTPAGGATDNTIQILEDISDIPAYDLNADGFTFDVWLFPPPIVGQNSFENEPPVLEWKVSL